MKKIILILSLCTLVSPLFSFAKQGCCSWHGGVAYCASNGRYVCNDGQYSPTCTCSLSNTDIFSSSTYESYLTANTFCHKQYGINSMVDVTDYNYCTCKEGYEWNNERTSCIITHNSASLLCQKQYGENSMADAKDYNSCICKDGYRADKSKTKCISYDEYCKEKYGNNALADTVFCDCKSGYVWDDRGTSCISYKTACKNEYGSNVTANKSGMCICESGYSWNFGRRLGKDNCISDDEYCKEKYGSYAYSYKNSNCSCEDGYIWNETKDRCISYEKVCQELYGYNSTYRDAEYIVGDCVCEKGYIWDKEKTTCVEREWYQFARGIYQGLTNVSNTIPQNHFGSVKISNEVRELSKSSSNRVIHTIVD